MTAPRVLHVILDEYGLDVVFECMPRTRLSTVLDAEREPEKFFNAILSGKARREPFLDYASFEGLKESILGVPPSQQRTVGIVDRVWAPLIVAWRTPRTSSSLETSLPNSRGDEFKVALGRKFHLDPQRIE